MAIRKDLKKDDQIPTLQRYELLDRIRRLDNLRDQALVCFLYLTGCRIEECCKYIKEINPHRTLKKKQDDGTKLTIKSPILERKQLGEPLRKKQFEFREDSIIVRNMRSLKRRKYAPRSVPIFLKQFEEPFIKILNEYLELLDDEDFLFNITRQRAYIILSKIGLFCHYLRHIRLTHLVVDYGFNEAHLQKFTGWHDGRAASEYVHLNVEDLLNQMRR